MAGVRADAMQLLCLRRSGKSELKGMETFPPYFLKHVIATLTCGFLPGRIELLLRVSKQRAVLAHHEARRRRSHPQGGQQRRRVAARDQTCERTRHLFVGRVTRSQLQMS